MEVQWELLLSARLFLLTFTSKYITNVRVVSLSDRDMQKTDRLVNTASKLLG